MKKNCLVFFKVLFATIALSIGIVACQNAGTEESHETEETTQTPEVNEEEIPSPPRTAEGNIGSTKVSVAYSSPGVKGRQVYGDLVPYGKVWRTGANAATIVEVSTDVQIEGQALPQGKYALFTIPNDAGAWTVIFNKTWDQWGAYDYDEAEDEIRIMVDPMPLEESVERLRFEVDEDAQKIVFAWDKLMLALAVSEG